MYQEARREQRFLNRVLPPPPVEQGGFSPLFNRNLSLTLLLTSKTFTANMVSFEI